MTKKKKRREGYYNTGPAEKRKTVRRDMMISGALSTKKKSWRGGPSEERKKEKREEVKAKGTDVFRWTRLGWTIKEKAHVSFRRGGRGVTQKETKKLHSDRWLAKKGRRVELGGRSVG